MARRPGRRLTALLTLLALAACSPVSGQAGPTSEPGPSSSPPTTTVPETTTSTLDPTTTSAPPFTTTSAGSVEVDAEVAVPSGDGPFPAVVLVHGGGWVTGSPDLLRPLADYLVEQGYLTVNTRYALADFDNAGFPEAVDDVACAVRYAATHPDSDGTVAVIGHSAGAHIGALVALTGDQYGADCPHPGSGVPERFVGLAGPYDVSRLGIAIVAFFGAGPEQAPEVWDAGNPQLLTDENTALDSLILYGDEDGLVDASFAIDFFEALSLSGSQSLLELVEGAGHNEVHDPDLVGDLIVTWLER
jgi:dienelactone hydrolase